MFDENEKTNQPTICNMIPGYSFYEGIGNALGELLVDFFEVIAGLIGKLRT